jgi:hypothetical protein
MLKEDVVEAGNVERVCREGYESACGFMVDHLTHASMY